ncbi:MAG TPA: biotin--[acetyl-CoA-carboxylase] ligase [Anaerolineales bacterium]|nr:biotin--[acetyl-CoA-carboxylase] ligase [Anaerolineales bacterium]
MNQQDLNKALANLPLGAIRYFDSTGSTNDEALAWAANDASDLSVVIANEQTAGRGRLDRPWFTPPSTALAVSLILHPTADERPHLSRIVGLAALALANSFGMLGLAPEIKWPNDILLNGRKVAGILIELVWSGEDVDCVVVGIGVNVAKGAVPTTDILRFPAISLEHVLGEAPDREKLLHDILASFISLRPHMRSDSFIKSWEKSLAYYDRQVQVEMGDQGSITGKVMGLDTDGSLKLNDENGNTIPVRFGDVRLRPFA